MKNKKDKNWLDENISKAVDLGEVKFDNQKWREKYILNEPAATHSTMKANKNFWRIIMENKVTRYSAAAIVTSAIVLVLSNPFGGSKYSGVVLADVQQNVADIKTMIIRGTKTYTLPDKNNEVFIFNGVKGHFDLVKYFSKEHGFVEDGYVKDKLIYRLTFNFPKQQTLIVLPPYKKYVKFTSTDSVTKIMETLTTPKGFFNVLIENDYKELGRDEIDGVEVEGFEFRDVESIKRIFPNFVFDIQDYKGKFWIGIEEQLPVRIEGDLVIGKSLMTMFNDLNLHEVNTLGEYNVELDEDIFDIEPPEEYTQVTLNDILQMIPTETKAGLTGLGILPVGFIFWKKHRNRKKVNK